jgi:small-conductance mechanosensitive channel
VNQTFFSYVYRLWAGNLPLQLIRAVLVAALFEALVYLINARLRRALAPALARDVGAENLQRLERRRIVLGVPLMLTRVILYTVALAIILRIFRFNSQMDLYPLGLGLLVLVALGLRQPLRDAVAGYLLHYDYLFAVGDEVQIGAYSGTVSAITLRNTKLRTRDGEEIVVPNSEIRGLVNQSGPRNRAAEK